MSNVHVLAKLAMSKLIQDPFRKDIKNNFKVTFQRSSVPFISLLPTYLPAYLLTELVTTRISKFKILLSNILAKDMKEKKDYEH